MVEEAKRVTAERLYWKALRSLNAGEGDPAAAGTILELSGADDVGPVSGWAKQTLADKFACRLVAIPA